MHLLRTLLLILAAVTALRAAPLLETAAVFPANSNGAVLCLYEKNSDIVATRFNLEWLRSKP